MGASSLPQLRWAMSLHEEGQPETKVDDCEGPPLLADDGAMGGKSIGFWGGVCLNLNNIMGPGMVAFPFLFQTAGWLPSLIIMALCGVVSAFASTMLCEAMRRIPGNHCFSGLNPETQRRYEFCDTVKHYFGQHVFLAAQLFLNLSLQASNIAAMIVCVQSIDDLLKFVCNISGAFRYDVWPPEFITSDVVSMTEDMWPSPWCLSLGLVVSVIMCVPLGMVNLNDNMWAQWVNMIFFLYCWFEFVLQFIAIAPASSGEYYRPVEPAYTPTATSNQHTTLGVIAFSWACVVTMPSWVNEKKEGISVNKSIWWSYAFGFVFKFLFGLLGAWAYLLTGPDAVSSVSDCQNILLVMDQPHGRAANPVITVASSYIFMIATLVPGIPVLAIVVRYNLLSGGLCSPRWASFWAVIFPWIITALLCNASFFTQALNWAALIFQGFVNFCAPPLLFKEALRRYPTAAEQCAMGATTENLLGTEPDPEVLPTMYEADTTGHSEAQDFTELIDVVPKSWLGCVDQKLLALSIAVLMCIISVAAIILSIVDAASGGS